MKTKGKAKISKPRRMKCLFVNFNDYKEFCEQINHPEFILSKTYPSISYKELKKSLLLKPALENFYEY